jgi:HAD superfamily hydrolase (TIGR01509 family)
MPQFLIDRYKAAIFDLDGTLVDSMRVWDHICRDWLSGKGKTAEDTLEQKLTAMTLTQAAEYVTGFYNITLSPSQIIKEWEDMVLYQYEHTIPLKDGAAELIKLLAAGGMKLGIASSCFPSACESVLSRHGIRDYFSVVVHSDSVSRSKAFPDIFLACAEKLGVEPKDCVVFEDLYTALTGIRAAGMGAVAVYDESGAAHWERFKEEADYAAVSLLFN